MPSIERVNFREMAERFRNGTSLMTQSVHSGKHKNGLNGKSSRQPVALVPKELLENHREEIAEVNESIRACRMCPGPPCNKHGPYRNVLPEVDATGKLFTIRVQPCPYVQRAQRDASIRRIVGSAHVPERYASIQASDYLTDADNLDAYRLAMETVRDPFSLYLFGETGCGKTMLASLVVSERIRLGLFSVFLSVSDYLAELRSAFRRNAEFDPESVRKEVRHADLLVLDDFGAECGSEWAACELFSLVNARYTSDRPMIITSNLSPSALCEQIGRQDSLAGRRIYSRIREVCAVAEITGGDRRPKAIPYHRRRCC